MQRSSRFIGVLVLAALCVASGASAVAAEMQGTVTVLKHDAVSVHSYVAPADGLFVTSQIIETPRQLVIVDAQYTRPLAQEVLEYAQHLGKPVARLYVSHSHPDHWNGLDVFRGTPVHALAAVRQEIAARNPGVDLREIPADALRDGREVIDGVIFELQAVGVAEGSAHLVIRLPQIATTIAQDLVYNGVHLYAGQDAFDSWAKVLRDLQATDRAMTVLAGHGPPTDHAGYARTLAYLEDLTRLRASAKSGADLRGALLQRYPDYVGSRLIDISLPRLYPRP